MMNYPMTKDYLSTNVKRKLGSRLGKRNFDSDSKVRVSSYERTRTEDSKVARKSLWWNRENEPPHRVSSIPLSSSSKKHLPLQPGTLDHPTTRARGLLLSRLQSNDAPLTHNKPFRDELNDSGSSVREFMRNEASVVGDVGDEEGVLPLEVLPEIQSESDLYQNYCRVRAEAVSARENVRQAQASLNQALYAYEECTSRADALLARLLEEKGLGSKEETASPGVRSHADLMDMTELYVGQRAKPSGCYTPASLRHRISQQIIQINQKSPCYVIDE